LEASSFVFYLFALVAVFSAFRVVTTRNPVHSALFLVLTFLSSSGIWLLLGAEFLALTLALVYVGAVMVLILFVVMMLDINQEGGRKSFWIHLPVALLVGGLIVLELSVIVWHQFSGLAQVGTPPLNPGMSNTQSLGRILYTEYVYPVELAAVILLVAMVAAIALTLRRRQGVIHQDPAQQVRVRARDRLRMVKMPAVTASVESSKQP
jgi:NADH-quinone oxidoreductase subunit J